MAKKVNIGTKPSTDSDSGSLDQWVSGPEEAEAPVKMKRLTLDIPEDLHKAIKTKAVMEGVPMANMLRSLLAKNYGKQ